MACLSLFHRLSAAVILAFALTTLAAGLTGVQLVEAALEVVASVTDEIVVFMCTVSPGIRCFRSRTAMVMEILKIPAAGK